MHAQVLAGKRAEACDVLLADRAALVLDLFDGGVEVRGVPQDNTIQDQTQDAEVVLEPAFVAVEQLPPSCRGRSELREGCSTFA